MGRWSIAAGQSQSVGIRISRDLKTKITSVACKVR